MIYVWYENLAFLFLVFIFLMCFFLIGKPKLKKLPSVEVARKYSTPELLCKASGWPVPRLSWWRLNGSQIHNGNYSYSYMIKLNDNGLLMKILSIEGYHHGIYFCRAENIFGASEEYVNIMVKSK